MDRSSVIIKVSPKTKEKWKKEAKKRNLTLASLIKYVMSEWIERNATQEEKK